VAVQLLLHVIRDGPIGTTFRFAPGRYVFGRSGECHLRLSRRAVSRRHCLLTVEPDRAAVRDLGSRNHTLVNSRSVAADHPLRDGDRLGLCGTELRVRLLSDQVAPKAGWVAVPPDGPGVHLDQSEESSRHRDPAAAGDDRHAVTVGPGGGEVAPGLYDLPLNIPGHALSLHIDLRAAVGRGRFGQVWWARTRGSGPEWHDEALKVGHHPKGSELGDLCRWGAMAVAALPPHPHVLRPGLVGSFGGRPLVATGLADHSLADLAGVLPRADLRPRLVAAVRDAAAGLDHLDAHGLVHGCPKPADVLFAKGRVVVADWDLVHHAHVAEGAAAAARYGDPAYLAPEVWLGWADGRSDQYALACGYAELRAGRRPFPPGRGSRSALRQAGPEPELGGLPAGERGVVGRALAKDPDRRFGSCGEFAAALVAAVTSGGGSG
jgi:pSer/pThr/pTyr-binding forkhead associated (FHA) protein